MDRLEAKHAIVHHTLDSIGLTSNQRGPEVAHVMTPAPLAVPDDMTVLELARLIHARGARHILVTDAGGRLQGVISDRDVIRCFGPSEYPDEKLLQQITTGQIMSTDIISIGPHEPLKRAASIMVNHGISCLPVMMADGSLVGIITNTDLHIVLDYLLSRTWPTEQPEETAEVEAVS